MSAPHIILFLPVGRHYDALLHRIVGDLLRNIDTPQYRSSFVFTAQREGERYFLIEYDADATEIAGEMRQWEKPSDECKSLLQGCDSCINIHYRSIALAKQCLALVGDYLAYSSSRSVVENGYGCLLRLSDIVERVTRDSTWSWERETFPDVPGVADSEWTD